MTVNRQKKEESGHETGDGHATSSGTRVTASSHAGPHDGQTNASAIVEIMNGHSESMSALDGPGNCQKTVARIGEIAHGQKGSRTSQGKSAVIHETATRETVNGHSNALHENLDLAREINGKSVSGSGP